MSFRYLREEKVRGTGHLFQYGNVHTAFKGWSSWAKKKEEELLKGKELEEDRMKRRKYSIATLQQRLRTVWRYSEEELSKLDTLFKLAHGAPDVFKAYFMEVQKGLARCDSCMTGAAAIVLDENRKHPRESRTCSLCLIELFDMIMGDRIMGMDLMVMYGTNNPDDILETTDNWVAQQTFPHIRAALNRGSPFCE